MSSYQFPSKVLSHIHHPSVSQSLLYLRACIHMHIHTHTHILNTFHHVLPGLHIFTAAKIMVINVWIEKGKLKLLVSYIHICFICIYLKSRGVTSCIMEIYLKKNKTAVLRSHYSISTLLLPSYGSLIWSFILICKTTKLN